jgi:hypothetical protein
MLQDYIQLLIDNDLHFTEEIKNLEKSCCGSSKVVIDYDKVKDEYCKMVATKTSPKSCDALLIEPDKNSVTFIEMKMIEDVFKRIYQTSNIQEAKELVKFIFEKEFVASKKILDSVFLFLDIARNFNITAEFFPYFLHDDCKKKIYFVVNCSKNDFVKFYFTILPLKYTYEYFKLGQPEFIPASNFDALLYS